MSQSLVFPPEFYSCGLLVAVSSIMAMWEFLTQARFFHKQRQAQRGSFLRDLACKMKTFFLALFAAYLIAFVSGIGMMLNLQWDAWKILCLMTVVANVALYIASTWLRTSYGED